MIWYKISYYEQKFPIWKNERDLLDFTDPDSCPIENNYQGPHIEFPLNVVTVTCLVNAFKQQKKLHAYYVLKLLHTARNGLKFYPNIRSADTSISNRITVCGDFHGKLEDLLVVFNKNGFPSNQNPYIFNGDYVDRGKHSLEVALILFSYFILYPDSLYLNRGNHEDCLINLRYGFQKEIVQKYDQQSAGKIIALFSHLFGLIPLGTVIDDKIFVCHGGISLDTDLSHIQTIKRNKYISLLKPMIDIEENEDEEECPPIRGESLKTSKKNLRSPVIKSQQSEEGSKDYEQYDQEWKYLLDLLWNDPQKQPGQKFNNIRGGGLLFGPDVTEAFLKKHNFTLLIRSHECKPRGYEFAHNNKLLTIFSASNYYELGSNNGAFVRIDSNQCLHFVEYISTENIYKYSMHQRLTHFEESAILNLKTLLFSNKTALMAEFKKYDSQHKGYLSVSIWSKVLEDKMKLYLPWRIICKSIAKVDNNENVLYETMFQDVQTLYSTQIGDVPLMEAIYRNKINLENIFRLIDIDNSGLISLDEFKEACQFFHEQTSIPFSEEDVQTLSKSLDLNNDGYIDLNEFLEAFRLVSKEF